MLTRDELALLCVAFYLFRYDQIRYDKGKTWHQVLCHFLSSYCRTKCQQAGIRRFNSALVLERNHLKAIWADYQRVQTGTAKQDHTARIAETKYDPSSFEIFALERAQEIHDIYVNDYFQVRNNFPESHYLFVKFEDLQDDDTAAGTLKTMLQFLSRDEVTDITIEDAFLNAETFHRPDPGIVSSTYCY